MFLQNDVDIRCRAGEMGYAYVKGVQSGKVAAMVKHYVRPHIPNQKTVLTNGGGFCEPGTRHKLCACPRGSARTPHYLLASF